VAVVVGSSLGSAQWRAIATVVLARSIIDMRQAKFVFSLRIPERIPLCLP